jgi:hypothetical protein
MIQNVVADLPCYVKKSENMVWHPEYANYMLEGDLFGRCAWDKNKLTYDPGTPAKPYGPDLKSLLNVEENMRRR